MQYRTVNQRFRIRPGAQNQAGSLSTQRALPCLIAGRRVGGSGWCRTRATTTGTGYLRLAAVFEPLDALTGRRARRRRHPRTFLDDCSRVPRNRISGAEVGQPQAARTWPEIGSRGHERHDAGPRTLMYAMPCLHVVLVAPYRPPTHIDSTW